MALYANAQRFFKILLISFKVVVVVPIPAPAHFLLLGQLPTAVNWANRALAAGKSVVFSIWTTMESRMEEAQDKVDAGLGERLGRSLLVLVLFLHARLRSAYFAGVHHKEAPRGEGCFAVPILP